MERRMEEQKEQINLFNSRIIITIPINFCLCHKNRNISVKANNKISYFNSTEQQT